VADNSHKKSCKIEVVGDYVLNVGRGGERITSGNSRILSYLPNFSKCGIGDKSLT